MDIQKANACFYTQSIIGKDSLCRPAAAKRSLWCENWMALSGTASIAPYGRWLATSVELLLWDSPRRKSKGWKAQCIAFFFLSCSFPPESLRLTASPYQSICSPVVREILTDSLDELRLYWEAAEYDCWDGELAALKSRVWKCWLGRRRRKVV